MLTGQRLCHSESHNDSVLAALNQQRSDGILCDVTLIAEEQKFHAHKAVLAACSDYFRAMFSLCMVESGADEVNLHGVTSLGLKQALEFAYTGQAAEGHGPTSQEQSPSVSEVLKSDRLTSLSEEQIWQLLVKRIDSGSSASQVVLCPEDACSSERPSWTLSSSAVPGLGAQSPGFEQALTQAGLLFILVFCEPAGKSSFKSHVLSVSQSLSYLTNTQTAFLAEKSCALKVSATLGEEQSPQEVMAPELLMQLAGDACAHTGSKLAVRWLEHSCHYQYMDELLQYIRFGLMDVDTLHTVALSHPLVQASETATALVNEALEYHQSIYAQPVWQTRRTKPRFQSDTLYIIGGKKREVCKVKELRYFNPVDQENALIAAIANWSELAPMPVGRSHHCVAVMGDFLFVAGGEVEHASGRTCAVRTACRYDPRSNSWAEIAPMKNCREHFVLGAMDEYLYAVGGRNELRQVLPTVERYCPKKNKWTFVQSFDRSLSCHAGYVADGLLWISGGVTNTAQYQNRLMVYEPNQNKWISRSPMLQRRVYHSMAAVQRKLYVLGGNDLDYNNDRILVRHIDSYNIDTDQWTRCNFNLLTARNIKRMVVGRRACITPKGAYYLSLKI
ncbi:hypothetical protein CB1_000964001 [Camelus ferus]|nr:hypothetical protein CB1_000964001 [Camelus ferus]